MVISSVYTTPTIVSPYGPTETNPICTSTLSMTPNNLKSGGAAGIDFDYAGAYFDWNGDSAPLLIRKGDGASAGWKFITYNDNAFTTQQVT